MNVKRGIGVLLCCLTIMGAFSFGGLQTKAALGCDHTYLMGQPEVYKTSTYDASGHYDVYADKYECPRCGYVRWQNEIMKWTGSHNFDKNGKCSCGYTR